MHHDPDDYDAVRLDRYRGALLGLATGDALGTTVEFSPPGTFTPVTDMVGGGPFGLRPGEWTDDTSMALCIATSLLERGGMDLADQLERFLRWRYESYLSSNGRFFDIGVQTQRAIDRYRKTGQAAPASVDDEQAGNGSLMRLAPVPMLFASRGSLASEMSGESSRTTHPAPRPVDACRLLGAMIADALRGQHKETILAPDFWHWGPLDPAVEAVARGSWRGKSPAQLPATGYVIDTLEAALWAFATTDDFRSGCLAAVNLGNDADTTGAVYGQLAGAFYGAEAIPREWRERLAMHGLIVELADRLAEAAAVEHD